MSADILFKLIDMIKNKFRKKNLDPELDYYLSLETLGEPNPKRQGVVSEEQQENIRKAGL